MVRQFRTIEDMERFYYGDLNEDMIKKRTLDQAISSDTAYWVKLVGAKVWSQINYEANAFAGLPKEPVQKHSWRIETAAGHSFPSGGQAEGTATTVTAIADTLHPTFASVTAAPKLIDHGFGMTWKEYILSMTDDAVGPGYMAEQVGKAHSRAISAMLVQDVDTPASNSMESLDRVSSSSVESTHVSTGTDPDIYGLDRSAATTYDAQVSSSGSTAATLRDLTVNLVDSVWASITAAGGKLSDGYVIFTRYNTIKEWSALLEAERRFSVLGEAKFIPRAGGAQGYTPGYEAGFSVATYNDIPIIPCVDYDSSRLTVRTNEVGPINFINTKYNRIGMAMPTVYKELNYPGDTLQHGSHSIEGHCFTIGELRCYNLVVNGKVTDIK